ncbi:MAG: class III signal peptide-containing protein [Candidatus ainarchaeum sp.]|nr:class III signal peptide-containing protein [Candidatus ainarchaeum sp.]
MFNKKGQGTIEYLIIIAVVVVIALVVVGLLLQVMNQGSQVPEQTAKIAWQSATPWAIVDWTAVETDGNVQLVLKNQSYETLTFQSFYLTDTDNYTSEINVAPGATLNVTVTGLTGLTEGERYSYPKEYIVINYDTTNISGKVQYGAADITGNAS